MKLHEYPYRRLAKMVMSDREAWIALGNLETRMFRRLPDVVAPVYVCGLARAGTTILTEAVARHKDVATHTYRDFPCLFTPYLWNRALKSFDWIPHRPKPRERAHGDGIMVTPRSPESMEEILWMAFFKHLHDENRSQVLRADTSNPAFDDFYRAHIAKLLRVRRKSRYASKANYNLTRIAYLASRFGDARFVIVVRDPVSHVLSLMSKHRMFCAEQERSPASLVHMDQAGHFEFGLHRKLIHTGDGPAMESIQACFAGGEQWRGWARYWAMMHNFIRDHCGKRQDVLVVRHEDICAYPRENLRRIFAHCGLGEDEAALNAAVALFRPVKIPVLSREAHAVIVEETAETAASWDYGT